MNNVGVVKSMAGGKKQRWLMSKTQWRREEGTVEEKAAEGFMILKAHVGFLQWEAIDREPAAVAAHHVDSISFEDVFCDLHAVQ